MNKILFKVSDMTSILMMFIFSFYALTSPFSLPIYQRMNNTNENSLWLNLAISSLFVLFSILLYLTIKRNLYALIAVTILSAVLTILGLVNIMFLLLIILIWLPNILVLVQLRKENERITSASTKD